MNAPDSSSPPGSLARRLIERVRGLLKSHGAEASLRQTIEAIIEEGATPSAPMGTEERTLLRNIFKLRELTAYDVMVPRADIVAVAQSAALADVVTLANREAHSRMPIYADSLDDIVGMVHIKDLLRFWASGQGPRVSELVRPVLFVAPSMGLLDLLLEMRKTRVHMALVVDEYGGIDGLVTIEDLVEEIVGEIEDEYDIDEGSRLAELPDGTFLADARLPVAEFEARFGPVLTPEERGADIDTLAGLVVGLAGRLPARGEVIRHPAGLEFEVLDADPRRVKRLKVRHVAPPGEAEREKTGT